MVVRNDEGVRIPTDASQDVQRSVQDVKDALRKLRVKQEALQAQIEELGQTQADDVEAIVEAARPGNFTEVKEETVFLGPVTSSQTSRTESRATTRLSSTA